MRLRDFLWGKMGSIWCIFFQLLFEVALGFAFQVHVSYLISIVFVEILLVICAWGIQFHKRRVFYCDMQKKLEELDQKYLITEMIEKPGFPEGDIFCETLYEIDRSMNERVSERERSVREFRDYVEMWIHEIKLPISALSLMNYNGEMDVRSAGQQIGKISNYVEQILYYARADAPQKDFLMKRCDVEQIVNEVVLEHKDVLIGGKFSIEKKNTKAVVTSDAKWLKFILGQLLNNSIKYKKGDTGYLGFEVREEKDSVLLSVEDHGIGVPAGDVERVFEKSFTGQNGRKVAASTGMGLYICRKMCEKLGHEIWLESEEGEYTRVVIRFGKDGYYLI